MLETINEVIDIASIEAQFEVLEAGLLRSSELLDTVAGKAMKSFDFKELNKAVAALAKENKNLASVQQSLTKITSAQAKAEKDLAQASLISANAAKKEADAALTAAKALDKKTQSSVKTSREAANEAKITRELTSDYTLLSKAHKEAELQAKNYALQLGEQHPTTLQAVKDANDMRAILVRLDTTLGDNRRNVGNYASGFSGLSNSIQQILREAPSAAVSLNTFFLAISNNLPIFFDEIQRLRQQIEVTNAALKAEAAAANITAVENARLAGATEEAAIAEGLLAEETALANAAQNKAPSILSQVAKSVFSLNTLLTLAVLGLTLFGGKIVDWIGKLATGNDALNRFGEATKKYNEDIQKASEESRVSAQKEINTLQILTKIAQDETKSKQQRLEAVAQLQKVFPDYFAGLSKETILYGDITNAVKLATQSILDNAKAKAYAKQADVAADMFVKQKEALEDATKAAAEYYGKNQLLIEQQRKIDGTTAPSASGGLGGSMASTTNNTNFELDKFNKLNETRNESLQRTLEAQKDIIKFQNLATASVKDVNDLFGVKDAKPKKGKDPLKEEMRENDKLRAAELAAEKELSDARRDLNNQELEQQIQGFKLIYENEALGLDTRLAAYGRFSDAKQKQAEANGQKELEDVIELEKQISLVKGRPENKRSDNDKALLLREEGIATRRKAIEAKTEADIVGQRRQAATDTQKIIESSSAYGIGQIQNRMRIIAEEEEKGYRNEVNALGDALVKKEINLKTYDQKVKEADRQRSEDTIRRQLIELDFLAAQEGLSEKKRFEVQKQIAKLRSDLNDAEIQDFRTATEKKIALEKAWQDTAVQGAQLVQQTIFDIADKRAETELKNLDLKGEALDANLKKEIDGINASTLAEKDKQEAIQAAEDRTAAAQKQIEDDRRKELIKRARTEKTARIASIITSTAVAVITAFTEGDPLTKIPRSIAAGIAGAAALASAIAAPIPQYADGTAFHPQDGPAIVNDGPGGERELITEPGKTPYWADFKVPTKITLPRGTRVDPERNLAKMAQLTTMAALGQSNASVSPEDYMRALIGTFESGLGRLDSTIKNKKETDIYITAAGIEKISKEGNATTTLIHDLSH